MIQGQSLSTLDKERKIGAMLAMQAQLYSCKDNVLSGLPAFHIDLNAGCGHNHDFNVPGSPMVFLDVMMRNPSVPFVAWFIDREPTAIEELSERIRSTYGDLPNVHTVCRDNGKALEEIAGRIPPGATGSVLLDPNHWLYRASDGNGVPVEILGHFTKRHQRMDVLMNLNVRFYQQASSNPRKFPEIYSVSDFHWVLNKEHWLITHPVHNGHTSFVLLTGRNFRTNDYKAYDWHHLHSATGREICERLEIVRRRRNGQRLLFTEESA